LGVSNPGERAYVGRGFEHDARSNPEVPVLAFILFLIIVWIVLGLVGAVVHGLIWLTIIAAVLFLATLLFGGRHAAGRRAHR